MKKFISWIVCCLFLSGIAFGQKRVIVVIGSSTAFGTGASPIDSSWVNLTKAYYKGLGEIDTIYNLAVGGSNSYAGLPTGSPHPVGRVDADVDHNVTKALSLNPDVVLISYPTNDVAAGFTTAETLANLHLMYQTVINQNKVAYVATSQPRMLSTTQQQQLKSQRDAILTAFSPFSLNFYNPIVAADSLNINPIYNVDGIHVNNGGHQQLFQVVKTVNILTTFFPLPLSLISFTATQQDKDVMLNWTMASTGPDNVAFVIQRSADGVSFQDIGQENATETDATSDYSWNDDSPLPGKSFYRLKITGNTQQQYSPIVTMSQATATWGLDKLYIQNGNSRLIAEIQSDKNRNVSLVLISSSGQPVIRGSYTISAPATQITIDISNLAKGQYFLKVVNEDGSMSAKAFLKL